eukprot:CAMPEP_0206609332 /NCGR_PEP_ID=MMETSP0325_2-20121206/53700_1 /ASSEMBLY_ACC=CAM_ASM_000347 /TAXON_ID=2866 /ORGANISM="Crypthecodinium cohnii, Strain Seligo" /LENGTH=47 /DNA_ID= /DNA_START= /DNA_END= /DNA_ORIENTATION=
MTLHGRRTRLCQRGQRHKKQTEGGGTKDRKGALSVVNFAAWEMIAMK